MMAFTRVSSIFLFVGFVALSYPNLSESLSDRRLVFQACRDQCHEIIDNYVFEGEDSAGKNSNPACERGCRFRQIINTIQEISGGHRVLRPCGDYCAEFYGVGDEDVLCKQGCGDEPEGKLEVSKTEVSVTEDAKDGQEETTSMLDLSQPVMQVRKMMSQMVGSLQIVTTYVLTYFRQDDETLVAVQSDPMTVVNRIDPENEMISFPNFGRTFDDADTDEQSPRKPWLFEPQNSDEGSEDTTPGRPWFIKSFSNDGPVRGEFFTSNDGSMPGELVLETESGASGVSRVSRVPQGYTYLIQMALLLILVTFTLMALSTCIAMARQRRRTNLKAANLAVAVQQEPLKLVRPEDLTKLSIMEEEEAFKGQDLGLQHAKV